MSDATRGTDGYSYVTLPVTTSITPHLAHSIVCARCGALIFSTDHHNAWHDKIAFVVQSLQDDINRDHLTITQLNDRLRSHP